MSTCLFKSFFMNGDCDMQINVIDKKKLHPFLNAQIAAVNRRKRFHQTTYELNGGDSEIQVVMFMKAF